MKERVRQSVALHFLFCFTNARYPLRILPADYSHLAFDTHHARKASDPAHAFRVKRIQRRIVSLVNCQYIFQRPINQRSPFTNAEIAFQWTAPFRQLRTLERFTTTDAGQSNNVALLG